MPSQVKITFLAEDSSVLRAQKNIAAGEKQTQAAMKQTADAAETAANKISAAKNRAARAPKPMTSGWVAGSHGVDPSILSPSVQKSRAAMSARIAASIAGGRGRIDWNTPELLASTAGHFAGVDQRARNARRESTWNAGARFAGVDTGDHEAVSFFRFNRAQSLRGQRSQDRVNAGQTSTVALGAKMQELRAAQAIQNSKLNMDAFGATIRQVGAAAGLATGALAVLAAVFGKIEAERQGAVDRKTQSSKTVRDLRQISKDQPHLDSMMGDVDRYRKSFGVDESTAADAIFTLESAGLRDEKSLGILLNARKLGVDPPLVVKTMQNMRKNYGYAGDADELIGKIVTAAAPGMANVDQIVAATGQSAGAWRNIGGTMEEQLGVIGTLSDSYKSTEIASERLASLSAQIDKDDDRIKWATGEKKLTGLDLVYNLERLGNEGKLRNITGKKQKVDDWLGESQAIDAYRKILNNRSDVDQLTAKINDVNGGAGGPLATKAALLIPQTDAVDALGRANQAMNLSGEKMDVDLTAYRDAIIKNRRAVEYPNSPFMTSTVGDFANYIDSRGSPADSAAFNYSNIATYADPQDRTAIYKTLGQRRNADANRDRLADTARLLTSPYNSAAEQSGLTEEYRVTSEIYGNQLGSKVGSATVGLGQAIAGGNSAEIRAVLETLGKVAEAMNERTKLDARTFRTAGGK